MPHTVVSLVPFLIEEQKPGLIPGKFCFKPSVKDAPEVLTIKDSFYYVYIDENRAPMKQIASDEVVAKAIVGDYCNAQMGIEDGTGPAMFYVVGQYTAEEIQKEFPQLVAKALEQQKRWFVKMCQIADNDWQRYHQHNVISDTQRTAAEYIGWRAVEHPWMAPMSAMKSAACPACGLSAVVGVVICPNCKCVLDKEKYKELQFA